MIAPICLFLYNRPIHSEQTIKALMNAKNANNSKLFVFCDGIKPNATPQDIANVNEVRRIADHIKGFQQITVIRQELNQGLGKSIIDGVSRVINQFGKVIVLEDDHVIHEDFLDYMNYYLNEYQENTKVMHLSGFARNTYLQFLMPRVFFSRYMDCWGWGTWANRWCLLNTNLNEIDEYLAIEKNLKNFNFNKLDYHTYFDQNRIIFKTWAIFWYYTIQANKGLCFMSRFSYVKNIGNDGSGSNEVVKTNELASNFVKKFKPRKIKVEESWLGEKYIQDAYAKRSKKRLNRVKQFLHKVLSETRNYFLIEN